MRLLSLLGCTAVSGFALLIGEADDPGMAANGSGNVAAFWEEYGNSCFSIRTANYLVGSGWHAPTRLSGSTDAFDPEAVMNSAGDMLVVWRQNAGPYYAIYGAAAHVGEAWSAPVQISSANSYFTEVGLDQDGNGVAVWQQQLDARNLCLATASFTPGSGWSDAAKLSDASQVMMAPELATGSNGRMVAAWQSSSSQGSYFRLVIQGAYYSAGAGWSAPVTLTDPTHDSVTACVGVSSTGEALVVWGGGFGASGDQLGAVTLSADGTWGSPVVISGDRVGAAHPDFSMNDSGQAVVAWEAPVGSDIAAMALIREADGTWGTITELAATNGHLPEVAINNSGKAVAIWTENGESDARIKAAFYLDGSWSSPVYISDAGQTASQPEVRVNTDGSAVAAWQSGLNNEAIIVSAVMGTDNVWGAPVIIN